MFVWLLSFGLAPSALAQDKDEVLALPGAPDPTFVATPAPADPVLVDRTRALSAFRTRQLQLRGYRYYTGGGATVVHTGWGWGYGRYGGPAWGLGTSYLLHDPLIPHDSWAVFQGAQRMTVPAYLELVGDPNARDFAKRIRRNRDATQGLVAVALSGAAAAIVGSIGRGTARTYDEARGWNLVSGLGVVFVSVGLIGGNATSGRARRLRFEFPETLTYSSVAEQIDVYNESLRTELGLTKRDVRAMEAP